ncbi:MAG: hypothetical protein A3D27_01660 [Omnitrophica WOR_2 bacterium RIFCSPHIGHO2_02_FULL_46_37]|nr:MAG: hypothetical protein A3D27_01660 [Omnitrophica WOR_2 bacterium RIFCSPHIGHO2_02_FULL_46_37]
MSIRVKLIITFLAIAVIPIFLVGALSFFQAKASLEEAALDGLNVVTVAKKAEVMEYLMGKKGRAIDFASDGFIRDQVEFISSTAESEEMMRASRTLNEHLAFNKKPLDHEILEIRVLDLSGRIIGTSEADYLLGLGTGNSQPYFLEGQYKTYIQDVSTYIYQGIEELQEVIVIGTPLTSRTSGKIIGVLANFYNLVDIKDVLLGTGSHKWGELPATKEASSRDIFLVNQQGLLATPSKKIADYRPLKFKITTEPVLKGTAYSKVINKAWVDMQKNEVLGASALLQIEADWKWILVIEQDKDEVLEPVYNLRRFSVAIGLLIALLVIGIAQVSARSIAEPIRKVTEAADKISKGAAWVKIDIASKDEAGKLAISFNRMVDKRQHIEDELKLAKAKIGEEKTKCEMVLASIGDGMLVVNQEGFIMMMNHEAEAMFGWDMREAVGKSFIELIPSEDEKGNFIPYKERIMSLALSGKTPVHSVGYYYREDNSKFPANVTASPIIYEEKIIGAIGIFRDITKEKEIDKMKTDFISTVSHEIRTPLTTIREGVSQALDGILGEVTEKQREVFSIVLEDSDRLKRIIDNLLDISKIEAGKVELRRELTDIVEVVKGVASTFALQSEERGLKISAYFSKAKLKLYVDKDRLIQVFTNLVGNALKFTAHGAIDISVLDKENEVECSVSDTGRGISKENLPRLFSKFQQFGRAQGPGEMGTGLGLSISKGIIELHKGKIWAESELNKGTKISFTLPKHAADELFREYVANGLKKLSKEKPSLSVIGFEIKNLGGRAEPGQDDAAACAADDLETLLRRKIRCESDEVVQSNELLLMLLPGVKKEEAIIVSERIRNVFAYYLAKKGWEKKINIACEVLNYPDDGKSEEELAGKILGIKAV